MPDQISAFIHYVQFVVGYWNPWGNAEDYGRLLAAFAPAAHQADPQAKVIYGGQADPTSDFTRRALDVCRSASEEV